MSNSAGNLLVAPAMTGRAPRGSLLLCGLVAPCDAASQVSSRGHSGYERQASSCLFRGMPLPNRPGLTHLRDNWQLHSPAPRHLVDVASGGWRPVSPPFRPTTAVWLCGSTTQDQEWFAADTTTWKGEPSVARTGRRPGQLTNRDAWRAAAARTHAGAPNPLGFLCVGPRVRLIVKGGHEVSVEMASRAKPHKAKNWANAHLPNRQGRTSEPVVTLMKDSVPALERASTVRVESTLDRKAITPNPVVMHPGHLKGRGSAALRGKRSSPSKQPPLAGEGLGREEGLL